MCHLLNFTCLLKSLITKKGTTLSRHTIHIKGWPLTSFLLVQFDEMLHNSLIEIFTSQVSVSVSGYDL